MLEYLDEINKAVPSKTFEFRINNSVYHTRRTFFFFSSSHLAVTQKCFINLHIKMKTLYELDGCKLSAGAHV